ncbi:MAG: DsbA family protein [Acidimicrobiales bacterium]
MTTFSVSFDYRCPFAKNIHLHVVAGLRAGAPWDVTFAPWTLSQVHREEGEPDVWEDSAKDPQLLALAAGVSVRDHQPELFLRAHEALFRARHDRAIRLSTIEEIDEVLAPTGVDLAAVHADIASRRPHKVIGESFHDSERYEAFGVPTFVVKDVATFVRYMVPPTDGGAASAGVIDSLLGLMVNEPLLNEFKRTTIPY